jgi:hypothetical protein
MEIRQYTVTLKSDNGTDRIIVPALDAGMAMELACSAFGAPLRAVLKAEETQWQEIRVVE